MGGAPPLPLNFSPQVQKKGQFLAFFGGRGKSCFEAALGPRRPGSGARKAYPYLGARPRVSRRWGYRCLALSGPRGPWDTVPPRVTYTHRWPPAPRDRLSGLELAARRQKIDPKQENEMKNFVKFPVWWGGLKIRVPDLQILSFHRPGALTAPVPDPLWPGRAPWSPLAALGAHPVGYRSARGRQDPHPTAGRFPGPWAPLVISD